MGQVFFLSLFIYFETAGADRQSMAEAAERENTKQAPCCQWRAQCRAETHKPWDHDPSQNQDSRRLTDWATRVPPGQVFLLFVLSTRLNWGSDTNMLMILELLGWTGIWGLTDWLQIPCIHCTGQNTSYKWVGMMQKSEKFSCQSNFWELRRNKMVFLKEEGGSESVPYQNQCCL